ncbi:envelope stress response membrane protein PspB [Emcibacter nanhaiensis]|uniref:Envelope stress response membrane protein PspB n=1 Tax=Emcibacter nanhaiensis TaxID=1505037 RepID=A0A501PFI6_9PROT|nr:envelope stress response membrane protein PspB [Emcibacter nanhaiensis]TPD59183.1 envelope stress response membrane protein PspB [Emcibacter nanhaiensis]
MGEVFGILFLVVVAPLWIIFHYITKWKSAKTLTSEDEQILADLYESAEKIESRLNNIERILDAESPDWRNK